MNIKNKTNYKIKIKFTQNNNLFKNHIRDSRDIKFKSISKNYLNEIKTNDYKYYRNFKISTSEINYNSNISKNVKNKDLDKRVKLNYIKIIKNRKNLNKENKTKIDKNKLLYDNFMEKYKLKLENENLNDDESFYSYYNFDLKNIDNKKKIKIRIKILNGENNFYSFCNIEFYNLILLLYSYIKDKNTNILYFKIIEKIIPIFNLIYINCNKLFIIDLVDNKYLNKLINKNILFNNLPEDDIKYFENKNQFILENDFKIIFLEIFLILKSNKKSQKVFNYKKEENKKIFIDINEEKINKIKQFPVKDFKEIKVKRKNILLSKENNWNEIINNVINYKNIFDLNINSFNRIVNIKKNHKIQTETNIQIDDKTKTELTYILKNDPENLIKKLNNIQNDLRFNYKI